MRPQTYFILLFLHVAVLRPDSFFTRGLLFQDGLPVYQPGSGLGHPGAFLHTDEVSPGTQLQGLTLSQAWSWRETFYSQMQMQKTGKHKLPALEKMGTWTFLKIWFGVQCKFIAILWLMEKIT